MDINKIIDNIEKYHYLGCGNVNCRIIGSSDSKSDAKKDAIEFLKPHWENIIGNKIFLVIIRKSTKGNWNDDKDILVAGPIYMEICEYIIKKNYKLKFTDTGITALTVKYFLARNILKKTKKLEQKTLYLRLKNTKTENLKKVLCLIMFYNLIYRTPSASRFAQFATAHNFLATIYCEK
jgi:hypothetical protein